MAKNADLSKLRALRTESRKERTGHRKYIVLAICRAFTICLRLAKNKKRRDEFFDLAKVPADHRPRARLTIEVLCYAVGRRTEAGQREASKRARVLEYLHKLSVPIKRMPAEIRKRGGILKVYKEAVEMDPRPRRNSKTKSKGDWETEGSKPFKQNRHWKPRDKGAAHLDNWRCNDQLRPLQFDVLASDLDTLRTLKPGEKFRLRAERCQDDIESRSLVRVLKVILN